MRSEMVAFFIIKVLFINIINIIQYTYMKKIVRLTEREIRKMVTESLKRALREWDEDDEMDEDDMEWRIDDICSEFGDDEVIVNGILDLWDGQHKIKPTPCPNMRSAIQRCIGRDGMLEDIDTDGTTVFVKVYHHDGMNRFEITRSNTVD